MNDINNAPDLIDVAPLVVVVVAAVLIVVSGAGGAWASVIVKISESITKHDNIFIDIFKGDLLALSFKF